MHFYGSIARSKRCGVCVGWVGVRESTEDQCITANYSDWFKGSPAAGPPWGGAWTLCACAVRRKAYLHAGPDTAADPVQKHWHSFLRYSIIATNRSVPLERSSTAP